MFEKIEKLAWLLLALAAVTLTGITVNRSQPKPELQTSHTDIARARVTVSGEVTKPGTYLVSENSRVYDAIYAAGGVTVNADTEHMELDARIVDGSTILVPSSDNMESPLAIPVIDINTADKDELMLIPGVGEVIAERIIEYREKLGSFGHVSEIRNVKGIGEKTFEKMKDYIETAKTN